MAEGDVKFDDGTEEFGAPPARAQGTDLTGKIVTWGLAKNREQAQYILGAIGLVAAGAAFIIAF